MVYMGVSAPKAMALEADRIPPMFYHMRDVLRMTALSRSSLYRRIAAGTFPAPVSLGGSAKGWRRTDLEQWEQDPGNFKLKTACTTITTVQGAKVRQVRC
ncbi:helix-turn-helix transcriptional regulator [Xenophilus azovorans]|uniref:helix-turn-helix transcriptional regulator n=1 Tax=Xenophilus azovorans TaxID=151755 RepID=UPI001FDFCF6A|nr:AlpA family phage regulatory protein [Xenophilus azovorans]